MGNQWRWMPSALGAVRAGLDWVQVEAVMRMRGTPRRDRASLLAALRIMEDEVLTIQADEAKRGKR